MALLPSGEEGRAPAGSDLRGDLASSMLARHAWRFRRSFVRRASGGGSVLGAVAPRRQRCGCKRSCQCLFPKCFPPTPGHMKKGMIEVSVLIFTLMPGVRFSGRIAKVVGIFVCYGASNFRARTFLQRTSSKRIVPRVKTLIL